jgi:DNA polymerase-3 subunit epsilon|tara:strand:+ start:141 stop:686 length:546 start_codon:yes stop_codon:yes gene_type:complete
MTRVVVLDTELTGLELDDGDRVISVGLVEVFNGVVSGVEKEWEFDPEGRKSHPDAALIHGLSDDYLKDKPLFKDVAQEILDFIDGDEIVHHCWYDKVSDHSTDEDFMNMEFQKAGFGEVGHGQWLNIKKWAQQIDPQHNSLDSMLDRYNIDRTSRAQFHGALVDARLTAEYYLKVAPQFKP